MKSIINIRAPCSILVQLIGGRGVPFSIPSPWLLSPKARVAGTGLTGRCSSPPERRGQGWQVLGRKCTMFLIKDLLICIWFSALSSSSIFAFKILCQTHSLLLNLDDSEPCYNEGTPDYFLDQGLYYPTATSYGYICTGIESTGDWDDHRMIFGLDGQDIQYTGLANESLPYVYYTPSYGYGESPYNPYNPYIPGAMIGLDGSIVAPPQYYALPSFENSVSPPAYVPLVLQARPDTVASGMADSFIENAVSVNKVDGSVAKYNLPSNAPNLSPAPARDASSRRNSFVSVPEGGRANTGSGKQPVPSVTSSSFMSPESSQIRWVGGPQGSENAPHVKASSGGSQLKTTFTSENGPSGFESASRIGDRGRTNRGIKARAGNPDAQGNIIIFLDQYNKVDFPVDYVNAKFFVIKSYSEDDVHKSIKYNVWSSTPNGNKKLNAAYEDAQKIAAGGSQYCPIFLFFSVNASGQFCGVAEMTGPVDFQRDMDFWQQDKWSGSFPVKWHIIKDLPNPNFRHIILENNENKPVTNSRDTQEICYKKGLEMLQIFKNYTSKTSLLDDFMYYENRQRILHEERSRLLRKSYENPYLVPLLDPPRKLQSPHDSPSIGDVNGTEGDTNLTIVNRNKVPAGDESDGSMKNHSAPTGRVSLDFNGDDLTSVGGSCQVSADVVANVVDELKISSLTIEPELGCGAVSNTTNGELVNVVTIGSMPVKVMGTASSGFLTVGTIPLDPRALQRE
ncbi:UNVERIFIED_CONTAM: YTH domain-containing protein ECT2 [Sesamum radiatum]|uniref:YTH domain-containing family protein n=1 Tax=Sesamum radiatum TaxID=300843 RepID=A0AAW2UD93_SESRA